MELGLSPNVQVIPTFQFIVNGKLDSIITGADMDSVEQKLVSLIKTIVDETESSDTQQKQ